MEIKRADFSDGEGISRLYDDVDVGLSEHALLLI